MAEKGSYSLWVGLWVYQVWRGFLGLFLVIFKLFNEGTIFKVYIELGSIKRQKSRLVWIQINY